MKITILPKTKPGLWSILLSIAAFILFVVGSVLPSRAGYSGLENIYHNPVHTIITVLILALGIVAPILALIAVIKKKERDPCISCHSNFIDQSVHNGWSYSECFY